MRGRIAEGEGTEDRESRFDFLLNLRGGENGDVSSLVGRGYVDWWDDLRWCFIRGGGWDCGDGEGGDILWLTLNLRNSSGSCRLNLRVLLVTIGSRLCFFGWTIPI